MGFREADLTPYPLRAVPLALAVALLGAIAWIGRAANPGPSGFPLDDAWIHLVYGRGLLANGFLAYQDGVPATGATSPVWATLLAAVHAFVRGGDPPGGVVAAVQGLGILAHVGAVLVAGDLARRLSGRETVGIVAGGLVALATPLAAAAFSGMEVGLAALLLVLGVRSAVLGSWGRCGVWLALAGGTRPEAAAVIAVVAGTAAVLAGPARRPVVLLRLLAAPIAAGAIFMAYDLWASGAPLPSAFYAKGSASLAALPGRCGRALLGIFPQVPPLGAGLGWLALVGFLPGVAARHPGARGAPGAAVALPGLAALAFLLANLVLIDPIDPAAFYHVRYLLPALPLLLVALTLGADRAGSRLSGSRRALPLMLLAAVALVGAARTAAPVSRHLHNDVRNINEVQRRIGEHLAATLPAGTRIATSDAGAVRYFSRLPTIDVTGLNSPEMRRPTDEYLRTHPVHAVVLLPAWYRSPDADRLVEVFAATTEPYTVTSNPRMARQVVLRLRQGQGQGAERVRFAGFHPFALDLVPWSSSPGGSGG